MDSMSKFKKKLREKFEQDQDFEPLIKKLVGIALKGKPKEALEAIKFIWGIVEGEVKEAPLEVENKGSSLAKELKILREGALEKKKENK